jgi:hypothetical protein
VPAVLETATGCEVLRASKPQSIMGSSHGSQRNRTIRHRSAAISIRKRVLWTTAGEVTSKNPVDLPLRLDDARGVAHNSTGPTSVSG